MEKTVVFPTTERATGSARLFAATGGAGLGVVVLADPGSPGAHVGDVCGRLVEEGFTALAPEVPSATGPDPGGAARMLVGAVDLLCSHDTVRGTGIGVVGFAGGAAPALWLAVDRPQQIRAVVPFYGLPPAGDEPDWARMQASVEGHFAAIDDHTPSEVVEALHVRLSKLDKEVRVFTYPNTAHGFFDDTRADVYDEDAAWQAWVRTLEFLRAKLG